MTILRTYHHSDHTSTRLSTGLGSTSWITDNTGKPIQHLHYLPFGEDWVDQRNSSWNAPYTFSGKEKDVETGYGYFGARYYDSGLSIWLSVDPMSDKYPSMSPYNYCANNPVILVDPDGNCPFPLFNTFRGVPFRIDSYYGERTLNGIKSIHYGLDINFGSKDFDQFAPVITTHDGYVSQVVDNNSSSAGRNITITSPDGKFRTKYFHIAEINVTEGQKVSEKDIIGSIGGSAYGDDCGGAVHLHYEIEKFNSETKKWEKYNPVQGSTNDKSNVVDPQQWLRPNKIEKISLTNSTPEQIQVIDNVKVFMIKYDVSKLSNPQKSQTNE